MESHSLSKVIELSPSQTQGLQIDPEFWSFKNSPQLIYAQGSDRALALLEELPEKGLGIVGTRRPQARSTYLVQKTIAELKHERLIIISGFALGIDSTAHFAALKHGLPTIAVFAHGHSFCYPPQHQELRQSILQSDGLILSEHPPDRAPKPWQFIERNRLIAAWSRTVWVVEAGLKSGANSTAKECEKLGRKFYVTPSFPGDFAFGGNQDLLDFHHARCFYGVASFGDTWLRLATYTSPSQTVRGSKLGPDEQTLMQIVKERTASSRGVQVGELFDWASRENWTSQRFFGVLQKLMRSGSVLDENGLLLKNPSQNEYG